MNTKFNRQISLMRQRRRFPVIFQFILPVILLCMIIILPAQALYAEATEEQLEVMNEIEGADITIGEYLQKTWPEFYDELSCDQKTRVDRWKRGWPKDPVIIEENSRNWHSQNITSYSTALNINLKWEDERSNLSLMVYSPKGDIFGPFYDDIDGVSNGQIYFYIRKDDGLPFGEWWYAVEGEKVNGTQKYCI